MSLIPYLTPGITKEYLLEILRNENSLLKNGPIRKDFNIWYDISQKDVSEYYVDGYNIIHQRKIIEWIRKIIQNEIDEIEQEELFTKYKKKTNNIKDKQEVDEKEVDEQEVDKQEVDEKEVDKQEVDGVIIIHKKRKIEQLE